MFLYMTGIIHNTTESGEKTVKNKKIILTGKVGTDFALLIGIDVKTKLKKGRVIFYEHKTNIRNAFRRWSRSGS